MKKMLLATALKLTATGCAQQTFLQNKPAAVAQRKPSPIIFFVLELGETVDAAKICAWHQKILLKQKPSKHS